jgi:hypothetical protein
MSRHRNRRPKKLRLQEPSSLSEHAETDSDRRALQGMDSILNNVRCPACRHPLVIRMGWRGPYFHCRCEEERRQMHNGEKKEMPNVADQQLPAEGREAEAELMQSEPLIPQMEGACQPVS